MVALVRKVNDAWMIEGHLDDRVDFSPMAAGPFPLRIRFGHVVSVNSVGTRAFLRFLLEHRHKGVEFHELSEAMIDLVNCIPGVLGDPPDVSLVKSLFITWRCPSCNRDESVLLHLDAKKGVPNLGGRLCSRCQGGMHTVMAPEDYFIFIDAGD